MCDLCTEDPIALEAARKRLLHQAKHFAVLEKHYRELALGRIQPHSDACQTVKGTAIRALRLLVEDFVTTF